MQRVRRDVAVGKENVFGVQVDGARARARQSVGQILAGVPGLVV